MSVMSFSLPETRIAIVANGKEEISERIISNIKKSKVVIAVDGGMNLCLKHLIEFHYLIGDLDSIDHSILESLKHVIIIQLERAKDILDLEAAIQLAAKIDQMAIPCIFNALGGRKDHHLSNLYLLLKYPRAMICSESAAVNARNGQFPPMKTPSTLFAFYDDALLKIDSEKIFLKSGQKHNLNGSENASLMSGEVLQISTIKDQLEIIPVENRLFPYSDDQEEIFLLRANNHFMELETVPGLTISLIPWLGPAKGIYTEGLKWNLNGDALHKDFVGVSNIALKDRVRISLEEGNLLCFVEKKIIDTEMIHLVDYSSTAKFT
jgi:thiamine pyrophosphokinase